MTHERSRGLLPGVLRDNSPDPERVTYVELFFDLVFAFAITQVAGVVTDSPTLATIVEGTIVTLAIWWIWVYTTWATNWLNPDARSVLWLLFVLTAAGLVLSESIPAAFEERRFTFVGAYLAYGLIRTLGVIAATRRNAPVIATGQYRILLWSGFSAIFWIGGAIVSDPALRLGAWALAILIEYVGPAALFWIPGLGRSTWDAWRIRGGHFSERAALFIIIVLGESILVVGAGLTTERLTPPVVAAAICAFIDAVMLWFLYFAHGQDRGHQYIKARESTGPVARLSYTYLHVVLVLGLVATTHGSHLALEEPLHHADLAESGLALIGPAIYLIGLYAFKRSIGIRTSWIPSHVGGATVLVILFAVTASGLMDMTVLEASAAATTVLILTVIGDEVLWRRRARTGDDSTRPVN